MIKDNLGDVQHFRLLVGKAPEIHTDTTLGDHLLNIIKEEIEGFDLTKDVDESVEIFVEFLKRDEVRNSTFE